MKNFVITISRGYGSGGKTIGKMLAENLGISFYYDDVLALASEKSGINHKLFAMNDENVKNVSVFKTLLKKGAFKGEVIPPGDKNFVSDENLFNYQAAVIRELAEKESCVIVGRAADYILKDSENVLKVSIQAPFESCVKTMVNQYSLKEDVAQKRIKRIDKERSAFYKYYTGTDWCDSRNYDITLNSDIGWQACVDIIKYTLKTKYADLFD